MLGVLLLVRSGRLERGITAGSSERYGGCGLECGHQSLVVGPVDFAFVDDPKDCRIGDAQAAKCDQDFSELWHLGGSQGVLMTLKSHHTKGMPPFLLGAPV